MKSDTLVSEKNNERTERKKGVVLLSGKRDEVKEKETKLSSYQSKHFSELPNSIKGHNPVDLVPNVSKVFLPKKNVFRKERGKQYI